MVRQSAPKIQRSSSRRPHRNGIFHTKRGVLWQTCCCIGLPPHGQHIVDRGKFEISLADVRERPTLNEQAQIAGVHIRVPHQATEMQYVCARPCLYGQTGSSPDKCARCHAPPESWLPLARGAPTPQHTQIRRKAGRSSGRQRVCPAVVKTLPTRVHCCLSLPKIWAARHRRKTRQAEFWQRLQTGDPGSSPAQFHRPAAPESSL